MIGHAEALTAGASRILGRPLNPDERHGFQKYLSLLTKWNKAQRLIGSSNPEWIVSHIFLDSLLFLKVLPPTATRILDLGAGAGVPGIPIRIVKPDLFVTMMEARQRRASFLAEVVRVLCLRNCQVVAERAEAMVATLGGQFDAVMMRCAGSAERAVPLALEFAKPGGVTIVSGPPRVGLTPLGQWVQVDGVESGKTRQFLIARK